jgi:hypothetical protein
MVLFALLLLTVEQDGLAASPPGGDFAAHRFGGGEVGAGWTEVTIRASGVLVYRHMTTFDGKTRVRSIRRTLHTSAVEARETLQSLVDAGLFALRSRKARGADIPTATFKARIHGRTLHVSLPMLFTPEEPAPAPEVFKIFRKILTSIEMDESISAVSTSQGLCMWVESAVVAFRMSEKFGMAVTFQNSGIEPVVILPEFLRRKFLPQGEGKATYQPYPGPPIPPWRGSFALGAGERKTVKLEDFREGDGVWLLEQGSYLLSISYTVPEGIEESSSHPTDSGFPEGRIWTGELHTLSLPLTYRPDAVPQ